MGFCGKPQFSPVPKMVKGIVIDHYKKTCFQVHHELMQATKQGYVRIVIKHLNGTLEIFDTGK